MRLPWRREGLRWAILYSAPPGEAGRSWGDTWFANDLADALRCLGQQVQIVAALEGKPPRSHDADIVLVLRGLRQFKRRKGAAAWFLWVISHPDRVTVEELKTYDAVFAASTTWKPAGGTVVPLLQATNPARFNPDRATPGTGEGVLFVGSTRTGYKPNRPILRAAIENGVNVSVYGKGWNDYIDKRFILGEYLPNAEVGKAYRAAGVVLNDHWADMAREGFLSNRLFDAVASGASVVSDNAAGLREVFGDAVVCCSSPEEIVAAIETALRKSETAKRADARRVLEEHSFDVRARALLKAALKARKSCAS